MDKQKTIEIEHTDNMSEICYVSLVDKEKTMVINLTTDSGKIKYTIDKDKITNINELKNDINNAISTAIFYAVKQHKIVGELKTLIENYAKSLSVDHLTGNNNTVEYIIDPNINLHNILIKKEKNNE